MAWYLVFDDDTGRPCQRGPYYTEGRAQEKLDSLDREGKLYNLDTNDPVVATRLIKEKRIGTLGLTEGARNMRHKGVH